MTETTQELAKAAEDILDQPVRPSIVERVAEPYRDDPIDYAFVTEAMRAYCPGSRPHPVEWKPDPIEQRLSLGVSTLVKLPAEKYAQRVINQREEYDETEGFYGEQGNTLAQIHFSKFTPYQENQARIKLSDERDLVCHIDAIMVYDPVTGRNLSFDDPNTWPDEIALRPMEHKHQDPKDEEGGENVDLAERQILLNAAVLERHLRRCDAEVSIRQLVVPQDFQIKDGKALYIPARCKWRVERVSVHFWARASPEPLVKPHRITQTDLDRTLDIYIAKAKAIEAAVKAKAIHPAIEFSRSIFGLQEYKRTLSAIEAGFENNERSLLYSALMYARGLALENEAKAIKKEHGALITSMFAENNQKANMASSEAVEPIKSVLSKASDGTQVRITVVQQEGGATFPKITPKGDWNIERFDEEIEKVRPGV